MKVQGRSRREVLYICCVYMPTDSSNYSLSVFEETYASLKEDVFGFKKKGWGFNAVHRFGRYTDVDDAIGI